MSAWMFVVLACLFVQGGHSYLLLSQKHDRKWSISDHAAVSGRTYLLYFACHFLGGLAWLIASYIVFYPSHRVVFWVSTTAVIFQWLQAGIPSKKGRVRSLHTMFAYIMWLGCMSTLFLGIITPTLPSWQRAITLLCFIPIFAMYIYMHLRSARIWHLQYATIYFFFLGMLMLSL